MTARQPGGRSVVRIHASCVLVGRRAVLIRGGPGSGKSSLVMDLLDRDDPGRPVRLVADDAVDLVATGGRLVAVAPPSIAGIIEIRGVGLMDVPVETRALVGLVVDLVPPEDTPRLPEPDEARACLADVALPRLALPSGVAGNAPRVLRALEALEAGRALPLAE